MHHNLAESAMLARLSISQWTGKKHDKAISDHVAAEYRANRDAGRYTKALLAADALSAVGTAAGEARTYHYTATLPWRDDGARILPAAQFGEYSERMRELRTAFEASTAAFCSGYDGFIEEARARLNGMFRAEDYPRLDQLRRKFGFAVEIDPMPTAADFRVSLREAEADELRARIDERNRAATAAAMGDLYRRLADVVGAMSERLGDPKAIFRDTLIQNARALVELLPRLNLTADPALEALRGRVAAKLCATEPEDLRRSPLIRQVVARDAAAILADMAGYTGGA